MHAYIKEIFKKEKCEHNWTFLTTRSTAAVNLLFAEPYGIRNEGL